MTPAQIRDIQAFFGQRAAPWEERFPDDDPAFERAVGELRPAHGGLVLDAGCGTGRAIPFLQAAIGPSGRVVGLDVTPEMLVEVRRHGRSAELVLADGGRMPFRVGAFDAILAAGFLPHLDPAEAGLAELARVTKPGGRLAIFHPIGRATLAARHGGTPSDEDASSPVRLPRLLANAGWRLDSLDDGAGRYLALAVRA